MKLMDDEFRRRVEELNTAAHRNIETNALINEAAVLQAVCMDTGMFPHIKRPVCAYDVGVWTSAMCRLWLIHQRVPDYVQGLGVYLSEATAPHPYGVLPNRMMFGLCYFVEDWYLANHEGDDGDDGDFAYDLWEVLHYAGVVLPQAADAYGPVAERIEVAKTLRDWLPRIIAAC